jgi:hypothetical protein
MRTWASPAESEQVLHKKIWRENSDEVKGKGAAPEPRGYWRSDSLKKIKKCGFMDIRHITAHQRLYPVLPIASAFPARDLQRF